MREVYRWRGRQTPQAGAHCTNNIPRGDNVMTASPTPACAGGRDRRRDDAVLQELVALHASPRLFQHRVLPRHPGRHRVAYPAAAGRTLVASAEAPIFQPIYGASFLIFLVGAWFQFRWLRAPKPGGHGLRARWVWRRDPAGEDESLERYLASTAQALGIALGGGQRVGDRGPVGRGGSVRCLDMRTQIWIPIGINLLLMLEAFFYGYMLSLAAACCLVTS